jgi:hypothetical protein
MRSWKRVLLVAVAFFLAFNYVFGWHVWPWMLREGYAGGILDNTLGALCFRRDRGYPSPDGMLIAIHRYEDCQGATGPGGHLVFIIKANDARWLKQQWLFFTEERVLIRSIAWGDERTVIVTTDHPLKYGTNYEGKVAYGVRLAHQSEMERLGP